MAEDHQTKNAQAVVQAGSARLIEERHLSSEVLVKVVLSMLGEAHTNDCIISIKDAMEVQGSDLLYLLKTIHWCG